MNVRYKDMFKASVLCFFMIGFVSFNVQAKEVFYGFEGDHIRKTIKTNEQFMVEELCKGKINLKSLNIYEESVDSADTYISPNQRYLVFAGAEGKQADRRWFLMDLNECRVVRELDYDRSQYKSFYYSAAFSPDSTKLYMTWEVVPKKEGVEAPHHFTKEYSGQEFRQERLLKKVYIPMRFNTAGKPYRFSYDGTKLLVHKMTSQWYLNLTVYDVQRDEEVFRTENIGDYFGKDVKLLGQTDENEYVPYIENDKILFNFVKGDGVEVNIFSYREKKIKNKIELSKKGVGRFSDRGNKIMFTEYPSPKSKKKDVLVFETSTAKQLGKAILDADDEAIDISNGKLIIQKTDGKKEQIDIQNK